MYLDCLHYVAGFMPERTTLCSAEAFTERYIRKFLRKEGVKFTT